MNHGVGIIGRIIHTPRRRLATALFVRTDTAQIELSSNGAGLTPPLGG
ncbi:MAG: hypothetical protein IPM76_17610 [Chloroflexi bacterium]|nr:hypothetical protein [Chloroflexota bacterium]